jgi:eukaryotic-like serine/threonine-protein kinase
MKVSWNELKQRRVVQILISYIAGGFVALNVFDQLADRGVVPELVYRIALIWYVFGIPAALLIGWFHGEKGRQKAPLSEISLLVMLVVMASGMSVSSYAREAAEREQLKALENPLQMNRIAVTYFEDHTDGEYRYLADGLTEDLILELSQVSGLSVVSRAGVLQYRDTPIAQDSLARALQVGTIVEGDVERRGNNLRVQLRLVEGNRGNVWRRHTINIGMDEALAARDSVVRATAQLLRAWLGEETRIAVTAATTRSTGAWALLQQGEKTFKDANAAFGGGAAEEAARLFDEADSLYARAALADASWAEPHISRAALAYRRSLIAPRSSPEAVRWTEVAAAHADEALQRSARAARAYEMRGTANYYRHLMGVEADARADAARLASAKADLERAVAFDPLLASAHASLAHVYSHTENDVNRSVLAAQRAWEADRYLENADRVLWRLFGGTLDQGSFNTASKWCSEALRRFPDNWRLAGCELQLMVSPAVESPDIERAWAIAEHVVETAPPEWKESQRILYSIFVAGAIARAADRAGSEVLRDSARAVVRRAVADLTPALDPNRELFAWSAFVWVLIGDHDRALEVLEQHAAAEPQLYENTERNWRLQPLESNPRFRRIMGWN